MADPYDDRPAWRRPVVYNDAPEPETADRPADVEDEEPNPVEEFGIDDDDELYDPAEEDAEMDLNREDELPDEVIAE